jgi:thiamine biosynthesis lipoprotein
MARFVLILLWILLVAPATLARAAVPPQGCAQPARLDAVAMGTKVRATICPQSNDTEGLKKAEEAAQAVLAEVQRLEQLWSTWIPESEMSRLNRAAGGPALQVSLETARLLATARKASEQSQGIFDITFSPLGEVWQFDTPPGSHEPTKLAKVPSQAEVAARLLRVGYRFLQVDAKKRTARLTQRGSSVHLGGIGKGAAVDAAVALLRARGFSHFAVQAGGDLYCAGQNGQRPWRIGIAHPRKPGAILGIVDIREAAFSTSGDYERFAILDGKRYHHILDLRSGWPAQASQSATVLAASATEAEILTKWAFVVGGAQGLELLASRGAKGVLVDRDGKVWTSAGLQVRPAEGP